MFWLKDSRHRTIIAAIAAGLFLIGLLLLVLRDADAQTVDVAEGAEVSAGDSPGVATR